MPVRRKVNHITKKGLERSLVLNDKSSKGNNGNIIFKLVVTDLFHFFN